MDRRWNLIQKERNYVRWTNKVRTNDYSPCLHIVLHALDGTQVFAGACFVLCEDNVLPHLVGFHEATGKRLKSCCLFSSLFRCSFIFTSLLPDFWAVEHNIEHAVPFNDARCSCRLINAVMWWDINDLMDFLTLPKKWCVAVPPLLG